MFLVFHKRKLQMKKKIKVSFALGLMLWAINLMAPAAINLKKARKKWEQDLTKANNQYMKALQRSRVYYRKKGDTRNLRKCFQEIKRIESLYYLALNNLAELPKDLAGTNSQPYLQLEKKINGSDPFSQIIKSVGTYLVDARGRKIKTQYLASKKYLFIYFSAHWCGPCRRFTPQLVKFYNKNKKDSDFEILFFSYDRSRSKMFHYMRQAKMPWPAIPYKKRGQSRLAKKFPGRGIPKLVLLAPSGKVLAGSYKNGRYVGCGSVLRFFNKIK
jgi:thiol-disulfide isomerase/thioredoxin